MVEASQLNTEDRSSNFIPNFSSEQLQPIAQDLSALNHRPSSNSDNYINVAGLFSIYVLMLAVNSREANVPKMINYY